MMIYDFADSPFRGEWWYIYRSGGAVATASYEAVLGVRTVFRLGRKKLFFLKAFKLTESG